METASENTPPRIYVACLAAYNNGILHGAWIDANQGAWAIYDGIKAMLDSSPITDAEEWGIHDYEGFEGIELAEYAGIEGIAEKAAFVCEHGRLGVELFTYYGSLAEAREALEDRYDGQFESVADFMQETTAGLDPPPIDVESLQLFAAQSSRALSTSAFTSIFGNFSIFNFAKNA